jgi:hypothetical protein
MLVTLFVTRLVGYLPIFLLCSGLTTISFVLMLQFTEESPWKADTPYSRRIRVELNHLRPMSLSAYPSNEVTQSRSL